MSENENIKRSKSLAPSLSCGNMVNKALLRSQTPEEPESNQCSDLLDASGTSAIILNNSLCRRESFLYNDFKSCLSKANSRRSSIDSDEEDISQEEIIVTPFAQIMSGLRGIRNNLVSMLHTPAPSQRVHGKRRSSSISVYLNQNSHDIIAEESTSKVVSETLPELDWCLNQLEDIQSHGSPADMTTCKFNRMLSQELRHFSNSKSGSQISEYILKTYATSCSASRSNSLFDANALNPKNLSPTTNSKCGSIKSNISSIRDPLVLNTPKFGMDTDSEDKLEELLDHIHEWNVNIFEIRDYSNNRPLTAVMFKIFQERNLFVSSKIPVDNFLNYMMNLEDKYLAVPYHNRCHAADVAQSVHVLLLTPGFETIFSDIEIVSALFSAAIHDVDHPGLSNQFLINSSSDLAILYNDESILENNSLAVAFKMLKKSSRDIFVNYDLNERQTIRKLTIDMVLATDMSKHMSLLADFKTMVETKASGSGILLLDNYYERILVFKTIMHLADLNGATKDFTINQQWVSALMEEFYEQGDKERSMGIPISPMCDRNNSNIPKSQVYFIDYILFPLWETWADLVHPHGQIQLDALKETRELYNEKLTSSPESDITDEV